MGGDVQRRARRRAAGALPLLVALSLASGGCSLRRLALNKVAATFAASGTVYAADDDPELVRDALPFALKTMESLLAEVPENRGLLLATCRSFTQYAYAFVELEAERLAPDDYRAASRLRDRALKLYLRARDYCFRDLELTFPGAVARLRRAPSPEALAAARAADVELLYWSGAAWGSAIGIGLDRPELVADLPAVRSLLERALQLEPEYDRGSIYEALISTAAVPAMMGGSYDRARRRFDRAVALSEGQRASPYVSLAVKVAVPEQDRAAFERLLHQALAIDPDAVPAERLANLVQQRRARWLLDQADELFLDEAEESPEPPSGGGAP